MEVSNGVNYAIILAGGIGSRFWPLSRHCEPKQFLNISSKKSMIEETIQRILALIERNNIYIATNKIYHKQTKDSLGGLGIPTKNILFESESKNTLAPIGLLSKNIYSKDKDAIILALPSDHYIKDKVAFLKVLNKAIVVAQKGYIVSLGITPQRVETGFGYIKVKSKSKSFYLIDKFIEKPSPIRANRFVRDKRFYWNAGIFIFRAKVILEEIKRFAPYDYSVITRINDQNSLKRLWPKLTSISIDYAIMQKCNKMALIPANFGWIDLGSWQAIEQLSKKDPDGNIFKGNCIDLGSRNTLAWSDNRLLATIGLDNIIIVDTKDAILVCAKDRAQEVKKLVEILKERKLKRLL